VDVADYLAGSAALALGALPWVPASLRLTRRLLPDRTGSVAALAASVVGVSGIIVVSELVGIADGFRRWVWAVVSALVALLVAALGRGRDGAPREPLRLPRERSAQITLACVVVCIVATSASLIGRDAAVVGTGPLDLDSIHYHLTQAAQIVHVHNIDRVHHTASSDGTVYYPYDAELLDAVGMLGPHPDLATFGLNLLFGWLALLACWVIGARWSRGSTGLAAGAAVIALPIVAQASSGPGLNDLPAMAFLLSAVAFIALAGAPRGDRARKPWLTELTLAGLALGLAAGTKLNALPIVILLALGVVAFATRDRWAAFGVLAGPALLTGGFWYIRDWVEVGSPVPDLNLTVAGHGFHVVPYPEVQPYAFTVAHYLGNYSVVRHWFVPGLHAVWTGLWPVVGLLAIAGIVMAIFVDGSWLRRMLGVVITIGFVAYLVTPTTAIGSPGQPVLFATNTRYALPTIIVAVLLLASSPRLKRFAPYLTVGFTALTLALLGLSSLPQQVHYLEGFAAAVVLGVLVIAGRELLRRGTPVTTALVAGIAAVAVLGAGALVQHHYLERRYSGSDDEATLFRGMGALKDTRIGVAGHALAYPFFGENFSNTVNYVGYSAPSHAFDPPASCQQLVEVLARLHDDYVVVEPLAVEHTDRLDAWIAAIPGTARVYGNTAGTVYKLPAAISASGCSM
jgi:hypothetical protein